MPTLQEILRDPNYINANPATKQAIFERWAPQDTNFTSANAATQDAIRQRFGVAFAPEPEPQPKEESGFLRQAADVPLSVGKGALSGVRMIADAFGAGSKASQAIKGAEGYLSSLMSAQAKNDEQEIARIMKDAEDKGVLDQVKAGLKAFTVAPVDLISQGLGTAAPAVLGLLGGKVLGAGALGARAIGAGIGATMGAGTAKGGIYEATKEELVKAGLPEDQAEKRAQEAQAYGGKNLDQILLSTGLGAFASSTGLEGSVRRILARGAARETAKEAAQETAKRGLPAAAKTIGKGTLAEAAPEFVQAGQEQVAQNIALQREGFDVPTFRGAAGAGTLEALAGAGLGAGFSAAEASKSGLRAKAKEDAAKILEQERAAQEPAPAIKPAAREEQEMSLEDLERAAGMASVREEPQTVEDLIAQETVAKAPEAPAPAPAAPAVPAEPAATQAEEPAAEVKAETPIRQDLQDLIRNQEPATEYDTPENRLRESDTFGQDLSSLLLEERDAYARSAYRNQKLRERSAEKQQAFGAASDAASIAFATNDYEKFRPYESVFPKTAAMLRSEINKANKLAKADAKALEEIDKPFSVAEEMEGVPAPMPPEIEAEVGKLTEDQAAAIAEREKLEKRTAGTSLIQVLRGTLNDGELSELSGRARKVGKNPFLNLKAPKGLTGSSMEDMVNSGKLDIFLPENMRPDHPDYENSESAEYIREKLRNNQYYTYDTEREIERINQDIESIERRIQELLSDDDINKEIQYAVNEQRELDQAAQEPAAEGAPGTPEQRQAAATDEDLARREAQLDREEELNQREARLLEERKRLEEERLKLEQPTREDIIAKEELRKAEEKAEQERKRADEEKAKADEAAADFVLTGSDRAADQAAARGQMELVPAEEAGAYKETKVEDSDGNKIDGLYREFQVGENATGSITLGIKDGRLFPVYVENGGVSGTGKIVEEYKRAIEEAVRRGLTFTSDASVTVPASKIYESLDKAGYDVRKNPSARLAQKPEVVSPRFVTDDGSPVYTVGEMKSEREQQLAPVQKLAEKLLDKGTVRYEDVEYEGKPYQARTRTFEGKLFGSELRQVQDAIGNAKEVTLINQEDRVMTLQFTGKFVGEGRNVRIMDTQYVPTESDGQALQAAEKGQTGYSIDPEDQRVEKELTGKTMLQAADWAIQNAPNAFLKTIAEKVRNRLRELERRGVKLEFEVVGGDRRPVSLYDARGYMQPDWGDDTKGTTLRLVLNGAAVLDNQRGYPPGTRYSTVLHELLHVATRGYLQFAPLSDPLRRQMRDLTNAIIDRFNTDAKAGKLPPVMQKYYKRMNNVLESDDEVLAWGLTDEDVQKYFADIKVGEKSVMTRLVELVRSVLGLGKPYESALDRLVKVSESMLDMDVSTIDAVLGNAGKRLGRAAPTTGEQQALFQKESEPSAVRVVEDKLPPVADGMTRVYRGEYRGPKKEIPEWIKSIQKDSGQMDAQGRWWTESFDVAKWYAEDAGPEGGVVYQDIPSDVVEKSRVKGSSVEKFSRAPEEELFLPMEYVGKGKPAATGNQGAFDPNDPNILRQQKGRTPQTETAAFKRWFGDSKVVDENGEPLVVYHGSPVQDFTVFDVEKINPNDPDGPFNGFFFSSNKKDADSAGRFPWGRPNASAPQTRAFYLSIKNPATRKQAKAVAREIEDALYDQRQFQEAYPGARSLQDATRQELQKRGYDGIVFEPYVAPSREVFERTGRVALGKNGGELVRTEDGYVDLYERGEQITGYADFDEALNYLKHGVFIAFRPEQIKSATGNQGTFDPNDPNILRQQEGRQNVLGEVVLGSWTEPNETKMAGELGKDDIIYWLQDKMVDTKRVVEAITKTAGKIAERWNPYLQEELYHGRTAKETNDFLTKELRPLMQEMQKSGVTIGEFEQYLHNRHAEEYNKQVAKVNPNDPDMQDGGSGIATEDAKKYLADLPADKRKLYESLAERLDNITKGTRELLVKSGLESRETIDAWEKTFPDYVPLYREDVDFQYTTSSTGTGQGFDVRGPFSRRAMGSKRKVVDILANVAMQRERAIVKANKNKVAEAVYGLAVQNANPDFWLAVNPMAEKMPEAALEELEAMGIDKEAIQFLMKEPRQRAVDPKKNEVISRINTMLRNNDNVLSMRFNGENRYVFFNPNNERAARAAKALKNLDADQLGRVLGTVSKITRWMASVNTQYNPIFGAYNFLRDIQGAALQLTNTPLAGKQKQVTANVVPALRAIYTSLRKTRKGEEVDTEMAKLWDDFQKAGGQTGFRDMFSRSQERSEALQKEFMQMSDGRLKKAGRATLEWLSDYNDTMENAVRLAAYKVALDSGMSKQEAASVAKNLTVNFNRKGQVGVQAGALYAFFNAAVQGTTRLVQTLKGPAGRKIMAGGLLLGTIQAVMLAAAGFDEEEPPEFVRERNIIIPIGGDKYIALPMPLGYHVIPGTSRILTEWVLSGFKNTPERIASLTGMYLEAFNPIGNAGWSVQTIAPTFADPLVALMENKDWTGKPIARKDFSNLDPTPGYTRAKDAATFYSTKIAEFLNYISGGTKYQPGILSPTPDQIDYLIGQATGGIGREVAKLATTVEKTATGEELPPYKIPVVGRFYGETRSSAAEANRFYKNLEQLNKLENEIKGRRENKEPLGTFMADNPEARLIKRAESVYSDVKKLRERKEKLVERGAPRESVKVVEEQITRKMRLLNEQVENAKK